MIKKVNSDTNQSSEHPQADNTLRHSNSRRRFIKGVASTTPVLLTVANRPVLASNCSVSGAISGNLSDGRTQFVCAGLTPGYWGQHPFEWPAPYTPGSCVGRVSGQHCSHNSYNNDGTMFHNPLAGCAGNLYSNDSMMNVIHQGGNNDHYQLGAHTSAAILNAQRYGPDVYGYNVKQVQDIYARWWISQPEDLKRFFQILNENRRHDAVSEGVAYIANITPSS